MTGGLAACFGCGERFALAELAEVGDAVFCRACLGRMLRRVDDRTASAPDASPGGRGRRGEEAGSTDTGDPHGPSAVRGPGGPGGPGGTPRAIGAAGSAVDRAPVAKTAAADPPCFLCGEPLEAGALVELHGFSVCARCARGLLGEDPLAAPDAHPGDDRSALDASRSDSSAGDTADVPGRPGAAAAGAQPAGAPAQGLWTPGSGTEWCSRCGRPMPGPGSYVLVDGRPHCAGCAVARAPRPGPARPRPASEDSPAGSACDACGRPLGAGPVPQTHGFRLCAACLHSDPELALALARARHQRRLARAGRRILDGDDD